jgi:hypothetical protein
MYLALLSQTLKLLMQQNFTQEDIILYIYNELDPSKRADLEMAIATNPELLTFFQESLLMVHQLDQISDEPSNTVISILNEESRSNSLEIH